MRILVLTTLLPNYMADSLLIGLRELYGEQCVEFPRKDILYGDAPCYYGRGFTMWSEPIQDVPRGPSAFEEVDLVIYACHRQTTPVDWHVLVRNKAIAPRVVYVDGSDHSLVDPCMVPLFKRELFEEHAGVFPIGFGIPERLIRPLAVDRKTQLHQTHIQDPEFTNDAGYRFAEEKAYYDDLAKSFFGITMKKSGWDCMRHYEIMAAGAVVMFKHLERKPYLCAPQCPHFIGYTNRDDFMEKTGLLLTNGKPNAEYVRVLQAQRVWLLANATCTARARYLIQRVEDYFKDSPREKIASVRLKSVKRCGISLFFAKERCILRGYSFVKLNPCVDWFYSNVMMKIPGLRYLVWNVGLNLLCCNSRSGREK
jgi:hypothetical protein